MKKTVYKKPETTRSGNLPVFSFHDRAAFDPQHPESKKQIRQQLFNAAAWMAACRAEVIKKCLL